MPRWVILALMGCGRIGFDPGTDAAEDPVYFHDDFSDLDYTANPAGAPDMLCNPGMCGSMTATVMEDADGRWIQVMRAGAPMDGGGFRVLYSGLSRPLGSSVRLRYRIRLAYDQLNTGGGACMEYGGYARLTVTLADTSVVGLRYVHNYGTMMCLPTDGLWRYSLMPRSTWVVVEHDVVAHLAEAGYGAPVRLDEVWIGGTGWNFETHFDEVSVVR